MKKILSFIICLLFCAAAFAACAENQPAASASGGSEQSAQPSSSSEAENEEASLSSEGNETAAEESKQPAAEMRSEEFPCYFFSPDAHTEVTLYFAGETNDIPYISMKEIPNILNQILLTVYQDTGYELEFDEIEDGIQGVGRENDSFTLVDFNKGLLWFSDYNDFFKRSYTPSAMDALNATGFNSEGEPQLFLRSEDSFRRSDRLIEVSLDNYGIDVYYTDGVGYLPLQTVSDLFLAPYNITIVFNGEMVGILVAGNLGALSELYYSASTGERSPELAEFYYNELCLVFDMYYGLKEAHGNEKFDDFFKQTGLDEKLKSADPLEAENALYELWAGYLADLHSGPKTSSFYAGEDAEHIIENESFTLAESGNNTQLYAEAREKYFPDGVPGYQEIGNTAYITFDAFTLPAADADYYSQPAGEDAQDTIGLIQYAQSRIMRDGSPVENVVIDLSNNGGGQADAAIYTIGWFLGDCKPNIYDTLSEGQATTVYQVDTNLDREFDEEDTVASKNLYCIFRRTASHAAIWFRPLLRSRER